MTKKLLESPISIHRPAHVANLNPPFCVIVDGQGDAERLTFISRRATDGDSFYLKEN